MKRAGTRSWSKPERAGIQHPFLKLPASPGYGCPMNPVILIITMNKKGNLP
jgi:hypothetical protein